MRTNNSNKPVYSISIRNEHLEDEAIEGLVNQIKQLLESDTPLDNVPEDIEAKVMNLKSAFDDSADEAKNEVLEYLSNYEANPMQGGSRNKRRKSKRTIKKSRNNRKSRKNRK